MKDFVIIEDTIQLNYDETALAVRCDTVSATVMLNFEIREFDGSHPIYRVLLDFLEDFAVGDAP
jgi:hypothetical protein